MVGNLNGDGKLIVFGHLGSSAIAALSHFSRSIPWSSSPNPRKDVFVSERQILIGGIGSSSLKIEGTEQNTTFLVESFRKLVD